MKIKHVFYAMLCLALLSTGIYRTFAYSPNVLPGGKNYLTIDNFYINGDDFRTVDPFLVKPYTEYTIFIPRLYADIPWDYMRIELYENDDMIDELNFSVADMTHYDDGTSEGFYKTFTVQSNVNYLGIVFRNMDDYFTTYGLDNFQLEEGDQFSGYEAYIPGTIIDTSAPYFQSSGTVISYVDSPITVTEIQNALTAYDEVDGDVSNNITLVDDQYTEFKSVLGSYIVTFEVSDLSGNKTQLQVNVEVVDVLKPVFSNLGPIEAVYPNIFSTEDVLNLLSASDNYDGDISGQIVLVNDNYSDYANVVGSYDMVFSVTDSSGNTQIYTQTINVVDEEGPIIGGVTSIVLGYDSLITPVEVAANLTYHDNYDTDENLELILESDNYTSHAELLGTYNMIFSVTDSSGNTTNQTIEIQVVDELSPVVYFDLSIVQTYTDTVMNLPDFTQLLLNTNELNQNETYNVTVRYDSYSKNATAPGIYHMSLDYESETGKTTSKDFEIKVVERPVDYVHQQTQSEPDESSFFNRYLEYFIGGLLGVTLLVSNVIWVVLFKKK